MKSSYSSTAATEYHWITGSPLSNPIQIQCSGRPCSPCLRSLLAWVVPLDQVRLRLCPSASCMQFKFRRPQDLTESTSTHLPHFLLHPFGKELYSNCPAWGFAGSLLRLQQRTLRHSSGCRQVFACRMWMMRRKYSYHRKLRNSAAASEISELAGSTHICSHTTHIRSHPSSLTGSLAEPILLCSSPFLELLEDVPLKGHPHAAHKHFCWTCWTFGIC